VQGLGHRVCGRERAGHGCQSRRVSVSGRQLPRECQA
jgi:hypothetical protein